MVEYRYNSGTKWYEMGQKGGETMFRGQFRHNLDDKGRLILPAKFREKIGDNAVITIGFEKCITIYPEQEWEKLQKSLVSMPVANKMVRSLSRTINGNASDVEIVVIGRVKIPNYLIANANIKKECVIVGVNATIEIWDATTWEQIENEGKESFEENAEKLSSFLLGIE